MATRSAVLLALTPTRMLSRAELGLGPPGHCLLRLSDVTAGNELVQSIVVTSCRVIFLIRAAKADCVGRTARGGLEPHVSLSPDILNVLTRGTGAAGTSIGHAIRDSLRALSAGPSESESLARQ